MVSYPLTPEQVALYAVARTTWRRRGAAKARGLTFGEESVTETILMDLAELYPGSLTILPFSKPEEGKNGADWAWLFRDMAGTHNLPMLVQAKALDFQDFQYPEIKRTIGKRLPLPRQIDRLIETAEAWGWPAIYAFYNHLGDVSRIPDVCRSLPAADVFGAVPDCWGISIADAHMVRQALNDQTFDTHRQHSLPLHCLLCSGGRGVRPVGGSALLALGGLDRLKRRGGRAPDGPVPGGDDIAPLVMFGEPPALFREALAIVREESDEVRAERTLRLASEAPGVAGVVVLQDAEGEGPLRG